jgi:hypothetical protein
VEFEGAHYNQAPHIRWIHHFTQKGGLRLEEKQAPEERCEVRRLKIARRLRRFVIQSSFGESFNHAIFSICCLVKNGCCRII